MALIKVSDGVTPDLARRARAAADKRPLLEAMGQAVKSMAIRAFTETALRPTAWAPRKDKLRHALLQKSTLLRKSIRVISVDNNRVIIGSDRPYAAVHQLGSSKQNIPARPYLPFHQGGALTAAGGQQVRRALAAELRSRGL